MILLRGAKRGPCDPTDGKPDTDVKWGDIGTTTNASAGPAPMPTLLMYADAIKKSAESKYEGVNVGDELAWCFSFMFDQRLKP